jgi:5-methylcytosine-specific restriction endonuclease McrA
MGRKLKGKMLPCQQCSKLVYVIPARFETFKWCSRSCGAIAQLVQVKTICKTCGKPFTHVCARSNTAKYCSRTCYYKAKTGSIELPCAVCGKLILRSPSHIKSGMRPCCGIKCRGLLFRKKNPKTSASTRVFKKRRGEIKACNRCGYNEHPEILVIHHKSRNRSNNTARNLEILCPNCHAIDHYVKRG